MTKFFRGGTIADTISDVPERIDKMLGNYKKVAMVESQEFILNDSGGINITFQFEFSFNPSEYLLEYRVFSTSGNAWTKPIIIPNTENHFDTMINFSRIEITHNKISLVAEKRNSYSGKVKFKIIAIE